MVKNIWSLKTNKMAYSTVLFDLDGVLTDPKVGITKSLKYALEKSGTKIDDIEKLAQFIGPPLMNTFQDYYHFDEKKAWKAVGYYREYFGEKGMYENILYPEIPQLLKELTLNQKKLFVVTSKAGYFAKKIIEYFKLGSYFTDIVGPELSDKDSTKTKLITKVITEIPNTNKKDVVMIGDRKEDIIAATNNGIDSIGVTYGYGSLEELTQARPTHIAESVLKLKNLLLNL